MIMRKIDQLFAEYGESHQNPTNKKIHWICVPLIFFSIVGLIASIPSHAVQSIFWPRQSLCELGSRCIDPCAHLLCVFVHSIECRDDAICSTLLVRIELYCTHIEHPIMDC